MGESRHGTRRRYQTGCRCADCKQAEADYQKRRRRNRTPPALTSVPDSQPTVPAAPEAPQVPAVPPESVQAAVQRELDLLDGAREGRPGLVATAMAMARILDNDLAIPQHPGAAGKLLEVLTELGRAGRKRKGKLAAVREMTAGA